MKKNTCFVMLAALMMAGCSNEIDEQVMEWIADGYHCK